MTKEEWEALPELERILTEEPKVYYGAYAEAALKVSQEAIASIIESLEKQSR